MFSLIQESTGTNPDSQLKVGPKSGRTVLLDALKQAGDMLLVSPNVSRSLSVDLTSQSNSAYRWLSYAKRRKPDSFYRSGSETTVESGQQRTTELLSVRNIALTSANLCLECAGEEY